MFIKDIVIDSFDVALTDLQYVRSSIQNAKSRRLTNIR